ncbi:MAG: hypothetical protein AAF493_20490 [Pseudomonadota bacterium]
MTTLANSVSAAANSVTTVRLVPHSTAQLAMSHRRMLEAQLRQAEANGRTVDVQALRLELDELDGQLLRGAIAA